MERNPKLQDSWFTLPDRDLAAEVLGAWREASSLAGLSRKRKVDPRRTVLGMGAMAGSGYAYPGFVSRVEASAQDGADNSKDNRETSADDGSGSK